TTLAASDTTVPSDGEEAPADTTPATPPQGDAETHAHLDGVSGTRAPIQDLQEETAAVHGGWDADPRGVQDSEAVHRPTAQAEHATGVVTELDALPPPPALRTRPERRRSAGTPAAAAAGEALEGLQSADDGTRRREAVNAFDQAVSDLETAIENARSAAGLAAPSTTEPADETPDTTEAAGDA